MQNEDRSAGDPSMTLPLESAFQADFLARAGVFRRRSASTIQINLGKRCNQACVHCHVDAGPSRTESMKPRTVTRVLELIAQTSDVRTVDITGGAPELHPGFRQLVSSVRDLGKHVIDRCNLTVLTEPNQEGVPSFLADNAVQVVASMPCYSKGNVDAQRGGGVFERSITGLRLLNDLGYGHEGSGLVLDLVYNPGGPFLPPPQQQLEDDYRRRLCADWGVSFNSLLTLTNVPVRRFRELLSRRGQLAAYQGLLESSFDAMNVQHLMCRDMISISWDGRLFDCDFNQMLELGVQVPGLTVWDVGSFSELVAQPIVVADHCFACTAGAGSSCGGALQ